MAKEDTARSIAACLTDDEILREASLVDEMSYDCEIGSFGGFSCGDNSPSMARISAVLRDYVRMRKMEKAVRAAFDKCEQGMTVPEDAYGLYEDIKRLLAVFDTKGE